jgi:hypothetical protein
MIRARFLVAATCVAMSLPAAVALRAQTPPAPDLQPVLAGRNLTPPLRGEAQIQVQWPPVTHRDKDTIITQIRIKNVSSGPLRGFTVDQPWYNKDGAVVASAKATVTGLFQPNDVQTLTLELPYHAGMDRNNYQFSHANGTVKKPETVAKLDAPATDKKPATPAKK